MNSKRNHNLSSRQILDLADEIETLEESQKSERLSQLPPHQQEEVFKRLRPTHRSEILQHLDQQSCHTLIDSLESDDQVRLLMQMPPEMAEAVKRQLSPEKVKFIDQLLQYPEESAGRILTPAFLALSPDMTVGETLVVIREKGRELKNILVLPVSNSEGQLIGLTKLEDLVYAGADTKIKELMQADPPSIQAEEDQELVGKLIQTTDLPAIPVVDDNRYLLGIITVDDVMDIMELEHYEDLARAGGTEPLEKPYFSMSIFHLMRSRVVWLLLLALAATLTVNVLSAFKTTVEQVVNLSLFIPLLIGVGGNAGAQAATTMVRAMAVDDVRVGQIARVAIRESGIGLLLGIALALVAVAAVWLLFGRGLALVVMLSLIAICTMASLVGATMPLLANRLGIDPAVVSAPLVTTLIDATGLLLYFLTAKAVLGV